MPASPGARKRKSFVFFLERTGFRSARNLPGVFSPGWQVDLFGLSTFDFRQAPRDSPRLSAGSLLSDSLETDIRPTEQRKNQVTAIVTFRIYLARQKSVHHRGKKKHRHISAGRLNVRKSPLSRERIQGRPTGHLKLCLAGVSGPVPHHPLPHHPTADPNETGRSPQKT